jgi:hypothetical protein
MGFDQSTVCHCYKGTPRGVKRFVLGEPVVGHATTRTASLSYASANSGWLWQYTDAPTTSVPRGTSPVTVEGETNASAAIVTKFSPPLITPPGNAQPLTAFQQNRAPIESEPCGFLL